MYQPLSLRQTACYRILPAVILLLMLSLLQVMFIAGTFAQPKPELFGSVAKIKRMLQQGQIVPNDVPNPHWNRNACIACHLGQSGFNLSNLRSSNTQTLCGACHNSFSKVIFAHPSGNTIPLEMWKRIPKKFQQSLNSVGGAKQKMTCMTCHDLVIQCLESKQEEKKLNPAFFRSGPFRDRVELCFYCHKANKYQRYNPHKQISRGKIDKNTCNLCHFKIKRLLSNSGTSAVVDPQLHSTDDLNRLCINCHPWRPHPGWEIAKTKEKPVNHLVKPPKEMIQRMARSKFETGINLPLGPQDGKISCATCHNPHQRGVIRSTLVNAGADSRRRLRLKKSCRYCHEN